MNLTRSFSAKCIRDKETLNQRLRRVDNRNECVRVYVFVCVQQREREREREIVRAKECVSESVCVRESVRESV